MSFVVFFSLEKSLNLRSVVLYCVQKKHCYWAEPSLCRNGEHDCYCHGVLFHVYSVLDLVQKSAVCDGFLAGLRNYPKAILKRDKSKNSGLVAAIKSERLLCVAMIKARKQLHTARMAL